MYTLFKEVNDVYISSTYFQIVCTENEPMISINAIFVHII